jgi:hypothetical protein
VIWSIPRMRHDRCAARRIRPDAGQFLVFRRPPAMMVGAVRCIQKRCSFNYDMSPCGAIPQIGHFLAPIVDGSRAKGQAGAQAMFVQSIMERIWDRISWFDEGYFVGVVTFMSDG